MIIGILHTQLDMKQDENINEYLFVASKNKYCVFNTAGFNIFNYM